MRKKIDNFILDVCGNTQSMDLFRYGNCFWFAMILQYRFSLEDIDTEILYNEIDNHFACRIGNYGLFDACGLIKDETNYAPWEDMHYTDPLLEQRIIRDCIKKERLYG